MLVFYRDSQPNVLGPIKLICYVGQALIPFGQYLENVMVCSAGLNAVVRSLGFRTYS